uniref:Uncharacterized protein n=1 Tax=Timema monikensis TaxID=170555 RepID=A0A7R9HU27_9NEOP|nr:unnamed protein product [Timema monikensis]
MSGPTPYLNWARGETVNGEVAPRPHGLGGGSNRRTQGGNMGVRQRGMLVATLWWGCMVWVWAEAASQTTQQLLRAIIDITGISDSIVAFSCQ